MTDDQREAVKYGLAQIPLAGLQRLRQDLDDNPDSYLFGYEYIDAAGHY